jgi:hypothetical protein
MVLILKNRKGQTMVEWLLLTAAAATTAYLIITGPFANFTADLISRISIVTRSIAMKGESAPNAIAPSDTKRFKPIHL